MEPLEHLKLLTFSTENERKKQGFSVYKEQENRNKKEFFKSTLQKATEIISSFDTLKSKHTDKIEPNLIFKLAINQKVDYTTIEKQLKSMNIRILSASDNKTGFWIVFSDDLELESFKTKLAQYSGISVGHKYQFFEAIDSLENINDEEKTGELLRSIPLSETESEYLNIELWRIDDNKINNFLDQIRNTFGIKILDKLITKSFALIRVRINQATFNHIIKFREIAKIDRPFFSEFNPFEYKSIDINELEIGKPEDDAMGILVIDSGILSNHPLLRDSVKYEENFQEVEKEAHDTVGHGTGVSGNCIYGDIEKCFDEKCFIPSNYLFSAKVMYGENDFKGNIIARYDPEKLIEHQLQEALDFYLSKDEYKIKVVNISFGNDFEIWRGQLKKQFPLASLIDEIALQYPRVVFVISSGNCDPRNIYSELQYIINEYPNYLCDDNNFKIINPATSSLSLTVGSISPPVRIFNRDNGIIWSEIAKENEPSPFSRCGGGINNAIKPELVEYGGNLLLNESAGKIIENQGSNVAVLSNKITDELITFNRGTSFSAPRISNLIGRISNQYPNSSSNFIKNLVLQSADYPIKNIEDKFEGSKSERKLKKLNTVGYGLPNYESSVSSYENRVLLFDEGEIGLDKILCYSLNLPDIFNKTPGDKEIIVTLVYNPITRSTRGDSYFGNVLEFRLFHKLPSNKILGLNSKIEKIEEEVDDEENVKVETEESNYKLDNLEPRSSLRKNTCHQKAILKLPRKNIINPLSLVIFNKNKWLNDENSKQNYCISLLIKHEAEIDLYNQIKNEIQIRARVRN